MENLGAITFRQNRLLVNEQEATHKELEDVADTVTHENAHMWFGDLVTMAWWDGLWLNEAFATFMEIIAVDHWKPEWHRWTTYSLNEQEEALEVDGLHSTRPIEFGMVDNPNDIQAMFDAITYRKGASVLRMLEQYLGPDVFRAGVRQYLGKHAYAKTKDLWDALERQAAGQDVSRIMDDWVSQPGFPLLSIRHDKANRQLMLTQRRFPYLKESSPALGDETGAAGEQNQSWQVPVQISITAGGDTTSRQLLLKGAEERLDVPENFDSIRVNESSHGFYRIYYDGELRERALRQLQDLSPIERLNLVKDMWAATLSENDAWQVPLAEYLDLATRFAKISPQEADKNVWVWAILIRSFDMLNLIIAPNGRSNLEKFVRHLVEPVFNKLGWEPQPGEGELIPQLRADLLRTLGTLGNHRDVQERAARVYDSYNNQAAVDGNMLAAVIRILAHAARNGRYDEFYNKYELATTPQDKQRYLLALASFQQPEILKETLDKTIKPQLIRPQDAPFVVQFLLTSVYGRELAWNFVKCHWEKMSKLYGQKGLSRVCAGVIGLTTPALSQNVNEEVGRVRIEGQPLQQYLGGKTLEQHLERLRIFVKLREREEEALQDYLTQVAPYPGKQYPPDPKAAQNLL